MRRWLLGLGLFVLCGAAATASAQEFFSPPDFSAPPLTGGDPKVGLALPGATAEEQSAALLWNLRAGLNVAALQCQGSPLERAVYNYNQMLANHGRELGPAYATLRGYFLRTLGPRAGAKAFDDYNTKTYNGFSTLHAQAGFCQVAGSIGKELLFTLPGSMLPVAQRRLGELRNSLVPAGDRIWTVPVLQVPVIVDFPPKCYDKRHELKKACLKDSYKFPY